MGDVCLTVSLAAACAALAVALLAARDARRHRLWQEQRPLEDRIADIRTSAAFMADQLQGTLDRRGIQEADALGWIAPVVAYYRRLEALAGAPFDRTYLAGSSNGAYYLTMLVAGGRVPTAELPVDGFAAISGGGAGPGDAVQCRTRGATHLPQQDVLQRVVSCQCARTIQRSVWPLHEPDDL